MPFDQVANFAYSTVAIAPTPATTGTSLTVQPGDGAKFPTPPFNVTVWPNNVQPIQSNAEIARVTNIVGDSFTITRGQENSSAQSIAAGWQIAETWTAKDVTDMQKQEGLLRPIALMGA